MKNLTQTNRAEGHLIASIRGAEPGPTVIVIGSIHGNEPAGVLAARRVAAELQRQQPLLRGEVVFLSGNTRALARNVRYLDADLNRHWTPERISALSSNGHDPPPNSEDLELRELLELFEGAAARARGELYVLDLHTTSAHGVPFATIGDTLRNRRFALNFPTTIVLGLEEQIEGTMLEYVNNLGAVTMGFEAGQHQAKTSIAHDEAVIRIALVAAGLIRREDVPDLNRAHALLQQASGGARIVEVFHRHPIAPSDEFTMEPGFENFQPVSQGQILGHDRRGRIAARETGMVLLPLYQKLGDDGFFLARKIERFWLRVSALLRRCRIGNLVHLLPGVRRQPWDANSFVVKTRIARFLPLQVLHLLGFRKRRWIGDTLIVSRRRYDLTGPTLKKRTAKIDETKIQTNSDQRLSEGEG